MRRLLLIGIGTGNPEQLTMQAVAALNQVDVFFVLDKGAEKEQLVRIRREILERYVRDRAYRVVQTRDPVRDPSLSYGARVDAWHEERAAIYERMLIDELAEHACGAFLVWGDPSLYDSTLRIVERVAARANVAFEYSVIPGISSVQALAASHRIALNRVGGTVHITTGRRLRAGLPADVSDAVVMLDGECTFQQLEPTGLEIYWGAYVGSDDELTVSGKLSEVADEIVRVRAEARAKHGWIMDIYLLRRSPPG
jgi:precorrin-6A synthase